MVAKLEEGLYDRSYSSDFLAVCKWLATRAEETLMMLIIHNTPEIITDDGEAREDDWKKVRAKTYLDDGWLMMFRQGAVTACHKYVIAHNTQDSETRVMPK